VCFTACKDNPAPPEVPPSLTGTSWKLIAFVDVENNESKELNELSKESNQKFRLTFTTDTSFFGSLRTNDFIGDYVIGNNVNDLWQFTTADVHIGTAAGDSPEGWLFLEVMGKIQFFTITSEQLKLFYNDKKNYLLLEQRYDYLNWRWEN
jgi:hypothetical protein